MKFSYLPGVLLMLLVFIFSNTIAQVKAYEIAFKMFDKSKQVKTMKYVMTKKERVGNKILESKNFTKINTKPHKVYMKQLGAGLEVLYKEGANNNKLLINPNKFPWMNVNLDPYSSLALKNQHHTVFQAGFSYFADIAEYVLSTYGQHAPQTVRLEGVVNLDGKQSYHLVQENKSFKFIDYKVGKGENLVTIANKYRINPYMIQERNPGIDSYFDVVEGQVIKIPNYYCHKMELYISKDLLLPLLIKVYDDKGLFQEYKYEDLAININIPDEEFSKDFEEYNF